MKAGAVDISVIMMSMKTMQKATSDGVRVNCICPWMVETAMGQQVLGDHPEIRKVFTQKGIGFIRYNICQ